MQVAKMMKNNKRKHPMQSRRRRSLCNNNERLCRLQKQSKSLVYVFAIIITSLCYWATSTTFVANVEAFSIEYQKYKKKSVRVNNNYYMFRIRENTELSSKQPSSHNEISVSDDEQEEYGPYLKSIQRRNLITSIISFSSISWLDDDNNAAYAAPIFNFPFRSGIITDNSESSSLYILQPRRNTTTVRSPIVESKLPAFDELSSELCLIRLLPVKNPFFRTLQSTIEGISSLRGREQDGGDIWNKACENINTYGIDALDKKRSLLQPVFNPDENSIMQISKNERFEILIATLRDRLIDLANATSIINSTETFYQQKMALLALSEIGELLVAKYPYQVPTEGLYSYLPRLLGRCKIIFTFRRQKHILGNITLIADGYAAPITAGNFVDLSTRGFYTGLPIKFAKKRVGTGSDFDVANIPIFGSYNDGFYDPLTAKPRRLPLELIRLDKSTGEPDLTYSKGLSSLTDTVSEASDKSRPLLSFRIKGLVAMNHPIGNINGASSEFFALQKDSMIDSKRSLLDGEYAPFGYIIDGYDIFQKLQPGDIIDATKVSEFGIKNLIKLRQSSFSEVVQGSGSSETTTNKVETTTATTVKTDNNNNVTSVVEKKTSDKED